MSSSRRRLLQQLGITLLAGHIGQTRAAVSTLTVLTGLPQSLVAGIEREFHAAHPDIALRLLWRSGKEALPLLAAGEAVDVYWAASAHNFQALANRGQLRPLDIDRGGLPGRIGAQRQSDAAGYFEATDTAGYAVLTNEAYLTDLGLPVPRNFADLADPRLYGHVVLPVPGRIGFAAPLYEHWLQVHGWQQGFELLLDIAANAELCSGHGSEVTERLARGEAGVGVSLDFFARTAGAGGIGTHYPPDTLYSPGLVGILAQSRNPQAARRFVRFLLSTEGQLLMAASPAGRLPMRPAVYEQLGAGVADPFRESKAALPHDRQAGLRRHPLVTLLFDAAITRNHEQLAALWQRMAEARRNGRDARTLAAARAIATQLPLSATQANRLALRADDPRRHTLRGEWRAFFARNYEAAGRLIAGRATA